MLKNFYWQISYDLVSKILESMASQADPRTGDQVAHEVDFSDVRGPDGNDEPARQLWRVKLAGLLLLAHGGHGTWRHHSGTVWEFTVPHMFFREERKREGEKKLGSKSGGRSLKDGRWKLKGGKYQD